MMNSREQLAAVAALGRVDAEEMNEHLSVMLQAYDETDGADLDIDDLTEFSDIEVQTTYRDLRSDLEE
jgi:hypothetical protein